MRLIDADALKKPLKGLIKDEWLGLTEAGAVQNMLDNAPTIDAVEVVRCKDCQRRYESMFGYACDFLDAENRDNDYCSYGERKE